MIEGIRAFATAIILLAAVSAPVAQAQDPESDRRTVTRNQYLDIVNDVNHVLDSTFSLQEALLRDQRIDDRWIRQSNELIAALEGAYNSLVTVQPPSCFDAHQVALTDAVWYYLESARLFQTAAVARSTEQMNLGADYLDDGGRSYREARTLLPTRAQLDAAGC